MTREHEYGFGIFGTRARVLVGPTPAEPLRPKVAALAVHARLQRLHRALTRFDPASELSRLNAAAGAAVPASDALLRALEAALAAARLSGGLVDPTVLPDLERAGYLTSRDGVEPADLAAAIAAAPARRAAARRPDSAWESIALDPVAGTARLPAGVRVDLGGSAKGMAADLAAALLSAFPFFAIDLGGDVRLGGAAAVPRLIRIAHPLTGETAHELRLTSGAIATSGLRTRVWRTPSGYAHHLIDPATGTPAWTGVIQATALAPSALEAETLAKTALLRGPGSGRHVLARHGGALVLDDGDLILAGALAATPSREPALAP